MHAGYVNGHGPSAGHTWAAGFPPLDRLERSLGVVASKTTPRRWLKPRGLPVVSGCVCPGFSLDTGVPADSLCDVIVYPSWKSSLAALTAAAASVLVGTCGCALSYIQGPDYQRLDLEVMRPIDVNHTPEPVK